MVLYHATYRKNLKSIKEHGLGARQRKNWDISESGVTYFTVDPSVAYSFCECAENVSDATLDSGIIVFAVDTIYLDKSKVRIDSNIKDDIKSYCYSGIIDPIHLIVMKNERTPAGNMMLLKRIPSYKE